MSKFFFYFHKLFGHLELKKLIATHYSSDGEAYMVEYSGTDEDSDYKLPADWDGPDADGNLLVYKKTKLKGNGDFRSDEIRELFKQADVIVTNPPFSLFREFVTQIFEFKKEFLIMGNNNAIAYRDIFKYIKEDKMWLGYHVNKTMTFDVPKGYIDKKTGEYTGKLTVPAITWFTNMPVAKRKITRYFGSEYKGNEKNYPKYDNYDAINVDRLIEIPGDYFGKMGVPITFLDRYNPEQFEIIDGIGRYSMLTGPTPETKGKYLTMVNNKPNYARIIIKRKDGAN